VVTILVVPHAKAANPAYLEEDR